jgi:hypothetical protein
MIGVVFIVIFAFLLVFRRRAIIIGARIVVIADDCTIYDDTPSSVFIAYYLIAALILASVFFEFNFANRSVHIHAFAFNAHDCCARTARSRTAVDGDAYALAIMACLVRTFIVGIIFAYHSVCNIAVAGVGIASISHARIGVVRSTYGLGDMYARAFVADVLGAHVVVTAIHGNVCAHVGVLVHVVDCARVSIVAFVAVFTGRYVALASVVVARVVLWTHFAFVNARAAVEMCQLAIHHFAKVVCAKIVVVARDIRRYVAPVCWGAVEIGQMAPVDDRFCAVWSLVLLVVAAVKVVAVLCVLAEFIDEVGVAVHATVVA